MRDVQSKSNYVCYNDEFTLKFVITSLCILDVQNSEKHQSRHFSIEISLDGNTIVFDNIETDEKWQMKNCLGKKMIVKASNDEFAEKLAHRPLKVSLIQGDVEIGSQTIRPSDCFVNSVRDKTFSSETLCKCLEFNKVSEIEAKLSLIFQIDKTSISSKLDENDGELNKKLEMTAITNKIPISTKLCHDEKEMKKLQPNTTTQQKSIKRICSECFEDLSVLPDSAKCPKCLYHRKLHQKLTQSKFDSSKLFESVDIRKCIKSILGEILVDIKEISNPECQKEKCKKIKRKSCMRKLKSLKTFHRK